MCKPFNGKMKEFKWRPGVFQYRLAELRMFAHKYGIFHDDRFHRTLKRLVLFADLEDIHIQPPCHWNYCLADDEDKIKLMNTECHCSINTDKIHYVDMNELDFHEQGHVMFTADHDVDFGFGGFYGIEMWTYSEENHIHQLLEIMEKSNQKEKRSIRAEIVNFINDTMAAYEDEVFFSGHRKNTRNKLTYRHPKSSAPKISKPKKVLTSRQKRLQADAIQAAKDAEEAKLKKLEEKKNDSVSANGKKKKKSTKTHFRKSQKPARL